MSRNPYDAVPYGNHAHPQTHPERLCSIGRLFGLEPADPRRARVLELGCASGGNLIPMAFNLPDARFLGIDLSGAQIDQGRQMVADLGLANIELEQTSIADLGEEAGKFDYVLCHGVYSWVPAEVRGKILEICRDRLAPRGVAFVSYNTLPGWHMVRSVRDMMLYHVGRFEEPADRAAQAQALLRFLRDGTAHQETPYAAFLASEMELLDSVEDAYLLHDHLEDVNRPFYFHEFVAAARGLGLEYLADSDLATMLPENLPEPVARKLREIGDIVRMEQYMDFLRNRRFRATLLCHGGIPLRRDVGAAEMRRFLIAGNFRSPHELEPRHLEDGVELSFAVGETTVKARGRVAKAALTVLGRAGGRPLPYEELVERTAEVASIDDRDRVRAGIDHDLNLCRLLFANAVRIHSLPAAWVGAVGARPAVTRLVRHQARQEPRVTNQRHEPVDLRPPERVVVQYLDGTATVAEIADRVREHVERGDLELVSEGEPEGAPKEVVSAYCREVLARLAGEALLVEEGGLPARAAEVPGYHGGADRRPSEEP